MENNNNTWKIDTNTKNAESTLDIIDLIADEIGIKWHEIGEYKGKKMYQKV